MLFDSDLNQVRPDPETQRVVGAIQQTRDINEPTESNSPKGIFDGLFFKAFEGFIIHAHLFHDVPIGVQQKAHLRCP